MTFLRVLLLSVVLAATTVFVGWWGVPVIAALYALLRRNSSAPSEAALAALLAWGGLLARVALVPAFSMLLKTLGGIFPMPGFALAIVALVFASLLSWSAARIITELFARKSGAA